MSEFRTIGIKKDVFDKLKTRAEKEERSITSMASILLAKELEE